MIISFYSYKGGVGRSQLCANVASYLCHRKDKKILLMDWDFEAPGLHYFFDRKNADIEENGTIELFESYSNMMRTKSNVSIEDYSFFDESQFISLAKGDKGRIDLVPAGNYNNSYVFRVNNFDWYEFYERLDGKTYIEYLKKYLKELDYDYVFIDSRTGINDYSGICNIQLPDANIVVMVANNQNVEGCRKIIDKIIDSEYVKSKKFRKSYVLPILSRISTNHDKYDEWATIFTEEFHYLLKMIDTDIPQKFSKQIFKDFYLNKTLLLNSSQCSVGEHLFIKDKKMAIPRSSFVSKYANIGDYIQNLKEEERIFITNQIDKETWMQWGELAAANEQREKAAVAYEMAEEYEKSIEFGGTIKTFFELANKNMENGNLKESIRYYEKVLEIKENHIPTLSNLASIYSQKGDFEKAIKLCNIGLDLEPDNPTLLFNLELTYRMQGDDEKALDYLSNLLKRNPNDIFLLINIANIYAIRKQYNKAIEYYEKCLIINPNNEDILNKIGSAYANFKDYEKALSYYEKGLRINPNDGDILKNISDVYISLEDYEKAIEYYEQVLTIDRRKEILLIVSLIYLKLKDYEKAIEYIDEILLISPNDVDAYSLLGIVCFQKGLLKEAKNNMYKGIESSISNKINLGHIYLCEGDKNKALEYYKKGFFAFENKNEFWKDMKDDLQYLLQYGITEEYYNQILAEVEDKNKLKNDDIHALAELYKDYVVEFVYWFRKQYQCSEEDCYDIFHRSMEILWVKMKHPDFINPDCGMKQYLYGISKNVYRNLQKKQKHFVAQDIIASLPAKEDSTINELPGIKELKLFEDYELSSNSKKLKIAISQLGEKCQELLIRSIVYGRPNRRIAEEMNYENEDSVKIQIYKCKKKLKKLLNT